MKNIPEVKLAVVAVSRNCFPIKLSEDRRKKVVEDYKSRYGEIYEAETVIETETDMENALQEVRKVGANALVVYLGNFGPETPETIIAKKFEGPSMFVGAAEDSGSDLFDGRGDAYCGMLNASYNLQLRNIRTYIPDNPVGDPHQIADKIHDFIPIARAIIGVRELKIITFGPRPQDFLACNAPIKRLYDLEVEIEENSELDLYDAFLAHEGDERISEIVKDIRQELGSDSGTGSELIRKFAQYELTLLDWAKEHKQSKQYVVFANKCWPSFQHYFGFVPCFNNSRLAAMGIPIACEVDIYGALSEYIGMCVSNDIVTLLDINNTVPEDMFIKDIENKFTYGENDIFMGFHCGNTSTQKLCDGKLGHHMIMCRTAGMETSMGTMNGNIIDGNMTLFRLQSTADSQLCAYIAQGAVLPVDCKSFGGIGIIGIDEMSRFYRYALIENGFPHHGALAFGSHGKALYEVFKYLGVKQIEYNRPKGVLYKSENPFNQI